MKNQIIKIKSNSTSNAFRVEEIMGLAFHFLDEPNTVDTVCIDTDNNIVSVSVDVSDHTTTVKLRSAISLCNRFDLLEETKGASSEVGLVKEED